MIISPAYKEYVANWTMTRMDVSVSRITLEPRVMSPSRKTVASPNPASMAAHVWICQLVLICLICARVNLDTLDSDVNLVRLYIHIFSSGIACACYQSSCKTIIFVSNRILLL